MSSLTELHLPPNLPYPIKIASLDVKPGAPVQRGARLLSYSFAYLPAIASAQPEMRFGTWDCSVEGTIDSWKVKVGDVISQQRAKQRPAISVSEPCKHGVQIGGLCGLCGKDMTDYDYTGFSDASRASIQMTHSAFGPTVSLEEAQRIEKETADHLLKSKKLSLIVDLDQTIVHATVDPTVGEWIAEGEVWEARQAKRASSSRSDGNAIEDPTDSAPEVDDECNPNWDALKDVKKFRLGPESFGISTPSRGSQKGKGKQKLIENDGCMYYIKPRPGWQEFLRDTATKYQMHVYTMGTRAYAEEVCAAIDPDGKIFAGRILSRDESGSLTQKSLQRLFPCDTSMVVIIDDRADVWEWSPNLIKVIPYDFFVGIGDINSAFLPKVEPLATVISPPPSTQTLAPSPVGTMIAPAEPQLSSSQPEEREKNEIASKAMLTQNSLALEAQVEERPLAKKQEQLQVASDHLNAETTAGVAGGQSSPSPDTRPPSAESPSVEKGPRKALLKNDDTELQRVRELLNEVHRQFFTAYESHSQQHRGKKRGFSSAMKSQPHDVTTIIPQMRAQILNGVHILFSSVIPLDMKAETTEIWKVAHMFGAQCYTELTSRITHVVAAKHGTVKVDSARRRGGIKIVWLSWFTDSIALWRRQDETPYLLDEPPIAPPSPILDPHQISSDPEPDADDWDIEASANKVSGSLEFDDINWNDINDEVEAAMNESDDDDTKSERSSVRSGFASDDDDAMSDDAQSRVSSPNATPRLKRKRLRSLTPSEIGLNGSYGDSPRSPLAKRKKIAAERSRSSKLKEAITADDLVNPSTPSIEQDDHNQGGLSLTIPATWEEGENEEEEEESDEDDDEDDFLARELEAEWG
ncbi:hypothetical protein BJ138DRAFT_1078820 [Hygrophoropsis aurantiaca]|uniref:Uncharacterized protein n=1 Tax=Hygrophoropsis aurantiaca TaxID=72124 RepID=A0ACB8ANB9_9AGAM|nr:hypothetical protein BJ138DRAFT_1078820 [Hygrophoropsis aurantiaca]